MKRIVVGISSASRAIYGIRVMVVDFLDPNDGESAQIDTFDGANPRFINRGKMRRFLRQVRDTEFIEVQYQP